MRICTLQIAPNVGEIENNIKRSDELLREVTPGSLDLLVLPELAFTGYNFPNLTAIQPYLEPTAAGISAQWAVATAARLNCIVIVGYPETTNDPDSLPTSVTSQTTEPPQSSPSSSPQVNFNSTLTVGPNGALLAHYRKSQLYYTDATWALPSPSGFSTVPLPLPLPTTSPDSLPLASFGICMDLSPRFFTAPWEAFELARHTLSSGAHMLLASMAWLTHDSRAELEAHAARPDLSTLSYWVERLRPLLRSEGRETLVVIANRAGWEPGGTKVVDLEKVTGPGGGAGAGAGAGQGEGEGVKERRKEGVEQVPGAEPVVAKEDGLVDGEARYAGTSCVMGLGNGRIRLWGAMGRAVEGVLRVDTELPPESVMVLERKEDGQ